MAVDACLVPSTYCAQPFLQSPDMQRYLLMRLLCYAADTIGASVTCTDAELKSASEGWWCQGSSAKLQAIQAQLIQEGLRLELTQPTCWTPLQLEGAITFLICRILEGPVVL